jgi:hypothetical protein
MVDATARAGARRVRMWNWNCILSGWGGLVWDWSYLVDCLMMMLMVGLKWEVEGVFMFFGLRVRKEYRV